MPLTLACQLDGPNIEVIKLLVRWFPEEKDHRYHHPHNDGDEPGFIKLCSLFFDKTNELMVDYDPLDYLMRMVPAHPELVETLDDNNTGKLALNFACTQSEAKDVVRLLLEAFPAGAAVADKRGRLPLHCACAQSEAKDVV